MLRTSHFKTRRSAPVSMILLVMAGGVLTGTLAAQSDLPRFGIGVSASTLGIGIQAATAVTHKSNIRAGFNIFDYNDSFSKDGVNYNGTLNLRSAQVTYDQYIVGGFHISPGVLIYDGNKGSATATVNAGQSFSPGNTTYFSGQTNPVAGAGSIKFNKAAPMILLGVGNILPHGKKHFGVSFEAGVVFQGSPKAVLNLSGNACGINAVTGCLNAATDPTVQANVQSEQTKINNSLDPFKYYPIISLTFSYKF
jgi:hypothetical protein